jgi:hypothetical protein
LKPDISTGCYYLANYLPPLVSVPMETAAAEFMRDREGELSVSVVVDYRKVMRLLLTAFPGRPLDTITTLDLEAVMATWGNSKKSSNNVRTYPLVRSNTDNLGNMASKI